MQNEELAGLPGLPPDDPHARSHVQPPTKTLEKRSENARKTLAIGIKTAGLITLINRRMYRDYSARKWASFRQKEKYSRDCSRRFHAQPHTDSPINLTSPLHLLLHIYIKRGVPLPLPRLSHSILTRKKGPPRQRRGKKPWPLLTRLDLPSLHQTSDGLHRPRNPWSTATASQRCVFSLPSTLPDVASSPSQGP